MDYELLWLSLRDTLEQAGAKEYLDLMMKLEYLENDCEEDYPTQTI